MAWRYRKRIKIAPGVSINLSRNGVSTTIGTRGASLSIGKNGTFINTGIPGTGLYNRKKISSGTKSSSTGSFSSFVLFVRILIIVGLISFGLLCFSIELPILGLLFVVGAIIYIFYTLSQSLPATPSSSSTSQEDKITAELRKIEEALRQINPETDKIKYDILVAYKACIEIQCKIDEAKIVVDELEKRNEDKSYDDVIAEQKKKIEELTTQLHAAQYNTEETLTDTSRKTYEQLLSAFGRLMKSEKVYCYKIDEQIDLNDNIQSAVAVPSWQTFDLLQVDGKRIPCIDAIKPYTIYFYPTFIIKASSSVIFDIIPYTEINTKYTKELFYWILHPASDCEVKEKHYLYETKDGYRDLRYSSNPETVHAYYGLVDIKNVNITYVVSKPDNAKIFSEALTSHIEALQGKKKRKKKQEVVKQEVVEPIEIPTIETTKDSNIKEKAMKNWKNPFLVNGNINMDDELLAKYERSINRLGYFMDKYCMDGDFMNMVKFHLSQVDQTYIPSMVAGDIMTCIERMGKSIDINSELGIPLALLSLRLMFHKEIKRNYFYILSEEPYNGICDFLALSKQVRDSTTGLETFFISTFYSRVNNEKNEKYLELLYDFANIIASLDGKVDPKEVELLNHILELQKVDNTISEEDKEKKEDDCKKQKTISDGASSKEAIIELDGLIGLKSVKKDVQTLTNFIKVQQERAKRGLKSSSVSFHCVFTGNPGTGKTTVARIVADIYKNLGVLKKGHLVETDRAGLVAEYVGQTAVKTNKIIDSALDGVLFIDEAYSLVGGGESDYGKEAIATLLKRMEDDRERLVVILAGYTKDMKQFIDSNPGLQSRFNRYIEFPDYTSDELYQIFALSLKKYDYHITDDAKVALQHFFEEAVAHKDANFGNGRFVRNIFEKVLERQANRLASESNLTTERLSEITIEDLP